jgi:hypothetical protein
MRLSNLWRLSSGSVLVISKKTLPNKPIWESNPVRVNQTKSNQLSSAAMSICDKMAQVVVDLNYGFTLF